MMSSTNLKKSDEYDCFHDWVGTGLSTSWGAKWHWRKRLLTPAFHSKILKNYIPIINEHATVMVHLLESATEENWIDIYHFMSALALDIICGKQCLQIIC